MAHQRLKPGEYGEIFISKLATGRHQARVRIRLFDGTQTMVSRNRKSRSDARLAVQAEIDVLLAAPKGSPDLKPDSKVGMAARQWIDELRVQARWPQPPIRPQTVDSYELLLGNHLIPVLGQRRLNELTTAMCQNWINDIVEKGKTGPHDYVNTASQVRFCLKAVIDRAMRHDALRSNPVEKVRTPRRKAPNPKAMKVMDVYRLRKAVRAWEASRRGRPGPRPTGHVPIAIDVMLGTGLRIGEVLALQWGEVKLTGPTPTIAVVATMVDVKGEGTIRQEMPKSEAGERTIVIPRFTVEALGTIRPDNPEPRTPVFPSRQFKDGRLSRAPQTTHNVRRTLRDALAQANMTGEVYPHLLRKTVATFVARERGVADAAALLGHKIDAGVTGKHYIERLRLAPDVSAVLQELVEIAEEEGAMWEAAKEKRLKTLATPRLSPTTVTATERAAALVTAEADAAAQDVSGW